MNAPDTCLENDKQNVVVFGTTYVSQQQVMPLMFPLKSTYLMVYEHLEGRREQHILTHIVPGGLRPRCMLHEFDPRC